MLSRFHLIPERNGETDRFAISISRVSMLTRDKNRIRTLRILEPWSVVGLLFCSLLSQQNRHVFEKVGSAQASDVIYRCMCGLITLLCLYGSVSTLFALHRECLSDKDVAAVGPVRYACSNHSPVAVYVPHTIVC